MTNSFDQKAAGWDQHAYRVERARTIATKILEAVPLTPEDEVLEFGCGTGLLGFHFTGLARSVTFADTSQGMLDQVSSKALKSGVTNVRTLALPSSTAETYDLIVSLMVLHHIEDYRRTILALATQVRSGGALCLCDLDQEDGSFHTEETVPHNGFAREEIETVLTEAGLVITTSCTGFVNKKVVKGVDREFPVFLIIGTKPSV